MQPFVLRASHRHASLNPLAPTDAGIRSTSLLYHREDMMRRLWWTPGSGQSAATAACEAVENDCMSLLQVHQMLLPGGSMHSIPHILGGGRDPDLARVAVHDPASHQQDAAAAPEGLFRLICVRQAFRSLLFCSLSSVSRHVYHSYKDAEGTCRCKNAHCTSAGQIGQVV